jgi:hypothetical protein
MPAKRIPGVQAAAIEHVAQRTRSKKRPLSLASLPAPKVQITGAEKAVMRPQKLRRPVPLTMSRVAVRADVD